MAFLYHGGGQKVWSIALNKIFNHKCLKPEKLLFTQQEAWLSVQTVHFTPKLWLYRQHCAEAKDNESTFVPRKLSSLIRICTLTPSAWRELVCSLFEFFPNQDFLPSLPLLTQPETSSSWLSDIFFLQRSINFIWRYQYTLQPRTLWYREGTIKFLIFQLSRAKHRGILWATEEYQY